MSIRRCLFGALFVLGLIAALRISAAELYAGLGYDKAGECREGELCLAKAAVERALDLWPGQPRYLQLRARVQARQGLHEGALQSYLQAQQRQPTWPYHSMNALNVNVRLGRHRGELATTLWSKIAATGKAERPVLVQASRLALRHWYRMGPAQRLPAMELMNALAAHDPRRLYRLANAERRIPLLCRQIDIAGCTSGA